MQPKTSVFCNSQTVRVSKTGCYSQDVTKTRLWNARVYIYVLQYLCIYVCVYMCIRDIFVTCLPRCSEEARCQGRQLLNISQGVEALGSLAQRAMKAFLGRAIYAAADDVSRGPLLRGRGAGAVGRQELQPNQCDLRRGKASVFDLSTGPGRTGVESTTHKSVTRRGHWSVVGGKAPLLRYALDIHEVKGSLLGQ